MELRLATYLLPLLLVLPIKGTDLISNGTIPVPEGAREPKANRRVVRLYSGARPKPIACAGEGFQADPDDCSLFHRCMKGGNGKYMSFRFQCGPGTIYDPETEICNHPQRTKRTECGGNGPIKVPNIEFTLENDISREIPSPMSTRDTLSIQKISETKDFAAKYTWTSHQNLQSTPSSSNPFVTTVIRRDTKTNKVPTKRQVSELSTNSITQSWISSQLSSTTPPRMTQPGDICAYEGFVGDSEDCHKFYRCINNHRGGFIRYEFLCNEPTIWDDEKQACNHAWAVKRRRCGRVSPLVGIDSLFNKKGQKELSGSTDKASDSKQSQLQINYGSKVTQIQTQISNRSVIQNQTQINYEPIANNVNVEPHITQNQTQISHGNAVSQTQTQTQLNYGDKAVQTQLQIDHSKESSQTQTQISQFTSTPKTTQIHETQETTSSNSNNKCTESGFVGDSDDCKKFYRCVDNGRGGFTRYEFSCGEGTVWDSNIEACNHAWAVKECAGKAPSHSTSQSIHSTTMQGSTKPITSSNTFSSSTTTPTYSSSTELTIEDDNDIPYGNQPVSSESSKPAESEPTATKSPQNTSDNNCNTSGFMGDSNDCKKFYRCVDNGKGGYTRYEFSCGEGTVWDQKIEACNHAWAVPSCGRDPATLTTVSTVQNIDAQTSSQKPLHNDDYDTGYGSQNNAPQSPSTIVATTTIKSSSTTTHQIPGSGNECTSSGFMGDSNDCKKFYRCVDNGNGGYTKYEFSCGEGTVWDSRIQACNHARDVEKCGENSVEDINKVETTTRKESGSTITSTTHILQPDEDNDVGNGQHNSESPPITTSGPENHMPESNECTSSGFIGDSTDCKKFYRCVDRGDGTYTRYEFSCGEGTVWDTKIEACNHAWAVEKCGGTSVSVSTSKPVQSIHTEENTSGTPIISDEYFTQSTITSPKSTTTTNYPSTTVFTADNNCKTSGFMGDSKDCKRFYRCVDDGRGGFVRYEFACGEGTVWDASLDACNHAWAVKSQCSQTGNYTSSNNLQSSTQSSSTENKTESEDQEYNQSSTQKTSTSTSAGSKPSGNQCTQEGFYGDKSNCKNFYRCVDNGQGGFIKYEFTCGEGTVWDQDIQACDHESPGKKCSGQSSGTTTKAPNHENDEMVAESTTKGPESSTENSENNYTQEKPQASDDKCKSEGFYGDSNDCQKFYRCADNGNGGYTKYEFTCGDGTYWDQDILACDHASNGKKCTISSTAATTSTSGTNMSESSTNAQEQQTSRPSEVPSSGNDQCTMDGFLANSYDCKKFYRCVSNGQGGFTKYDFSCGEGTVWVQEIQACDYDNDISSCSTKNNSSKPGTNEEHQSTSSISSSTSGHTTQSQIPDKENDEYPGSSSSKPPAASEQCTSEGFHANEYDCTRFYRCVDNGQGGYTKYDFTCGEGTAWDSNIQTCNHINEVDSCKSANEETKPSNDESTQSSQSTSTTKDTSSTESSIENECNQEGFYGNTQDCTKFYRCVDNGKGGLTKYDFTCGEGTIWAQDLTTCNHPQDVNNPSCEKNEDNESSSGSSSSTESSGSTSASSTTSQSSEGITEGNNQGSSNCSQETSTKKPTNIKYKCEKAGFYPDPDDCKKFYRCVDWDGNGNKFSVYHFDCGEGTIWDPELETCNHEDSVYPPRNCSGTQSQNQNVSQETTTTETPTTSQDNSSTESTTTTQSSTEEPSTTQQPSSSEQTTQHTSTEKTTTQQSSTTEKTTTEQQSTSEQTTQQTSTELTTTQQTTSSEKTTEQTTSEQTTTVQTTTSQELTTQETATSQPTTSSEQTTSEQMTTSVQSTTQPSTTIQQSTQQSSSSESSTTEQFTTQESTTSKQTTQQSSSTDATTTESGHTEQQSTTSKEQTTATTEQTDQQSTTEQTVAVNTTEQETSTTEASTTTTTGSSESTTTDSDQGTTSQETSSEKECPETEEDQYLYVCPTSFKRHPKYCNMFYQCTEDNESHDVKIANFKCPNNTIYDESKTQCVEEEKADKKCNGQIARKQRGKRRNADYKEPIEVGRNVNQCPAVGYYPFEKDIECSGAFLKCQMTKSGRLRGYVHRCPDGYTYWSISKRCEKNNDMKDCKQSANIWSNRYEIPVEKKNIAK